MVRKAATDLEAGLLRTAQPVSVSYLKAYTTGTEYIEVGARCTGKCLAKIRVANHPPHDGWVDGAVYAYDLRRIPGAVEALAAIIARFVLLDWRQVDHTRAVQAAEGA